MITEEKSSLTFSSSANSWPMFQKYVFIFKIIIEMCSPFFPPCIFPPMEKKGEHISTVAIVTMKKNLVIVVMALIRGGGGNCAK